MDGIVDYTRYTSDELYQALQTIDRERYPVNYEHLADEIGKRGLSLEVRSDWRAHTRDEPASGDVFRIWFKRKGFSRVSDNSFGFVGRGELRLENEEAQFSGKTRGFAWSGKRQSLKFPLSELANIEHDGHSVRVEVRSPDEPVRYLTFAAEEGVAAQLARRLPATQTVHYRATRAEIADFQRRLNTVSPHAPVTHALVGVNIAVFLVMALAGAGVFDADGQIHVRWGSNFVPLTTAGEWWRLFTSMFLHFGVMHLAFNMWALYANGVLAERLLGSGRFAALYLLAGVAGSLASAGYNPFVNSAGASGAIFGVFGGMLAFMLSKKNRVPVAVMVKHRNSILAFVLFNIVNGFAHVGIDNAAHLGGLAAGFVLGLALARPVDPELRANDESHRLPATISVSVAILLSMAVGIVHGRATLAPDTQFRADLMWYGQGESRSIDAFNELVALAKSDKINDPHYVDRLEREVIPFWEWAAQRFLANKPRDASAIAQWLEYSALIKNRRESFTELSMAIHQGDQAKAKAAARKLNQGERIIEKIKKLSDTK